MKFQVGDRVRANRDCSLDWKLEELDIEKVYTVSEVHLSDVWGEYVQLKDIHSSYRVDWLSKVICEKEVML